MDDIVIAGIGQVPVGEHWELSLRSLAVRAMQAARKECPAVQPTALYIGNLLSPVVSHQSNLGAVLTDWGFLEGIEAYTCEAAEASGAAAFRMGYLAVKSGYVDAALVVGVEKPTDMVGSVGDSAQAQVLDYDYEKVQGLTPVTQAALLMQRYLADYKPPRATFAGFPMNALQNAVNNPNAMLRKTITRQQYEQAEAVVDPLNLHDIAPIGDGAAAVLLTRRDRLPKDHPYPVVRVAGSASAIDTLALHDRPDPLGFMAATLSMQDACDQAGVNPGDLDMFELTDNTTIQAVLTLEACGFAERGQAWQLAENGDLSRTGKLPIAVMGGMKGRGNPLGAGGMYQLVEAVQQLCGQAGANQIKDARCAAVQSLGGPASTAVTHVLVRE
jgi:acetyl-CoA C-acetyltransferase